MSETPESQHRMEPTAFSTSAASSQCHAMSSEQMAMHLARTTTDSSELRSLWCTVTERLMGNGDWLAGWLLHLCQSEGS
uniref:Uncharacterized protein n=1 Tax=Knipowitschia caucasica TaxID=637954 RepID=A0AAV2M8D8_KNICA